MTRHTGILAGIAVLAASAACMQVETTHSLYLSPDGSIVWTVSGRDARSDESDRTKRWTEEQRFLEAVESGHHAAAAALRQIGGTTVTTQLLRRTRPFDVRTTAQFSAVDQLADAILLELRLPGRATIERTDGRTTLTVTVDLTSDPEVDGYEGPLVDLIEDLPQYRIVLTDGRFVAAEGFKISDDGMVATPVETEAMPVRLMLAWGN